METVVKQNSDYGYGAETKHAVVTRKTNSKLARRLTKGYGEMLAVKPEVNQDTYQSLIEIKQKRQELSVKRSRLFFTIGLCISILVCIAAFEWDFIDTNTVLEFNEEHNALNEFIAEVPKTKQLPPKLPEVIKQPIIKEVPDEILIEEIEIDMDTEVDDETKVDVIDYSIFDFPEQEEEVAEEIFTIVEVRPEPEGGIGSFYQHVKNNLKYPRSAMRQNIQGRVYVKFVVEKDGTLTDTQVLKGIGGGCDEEAVRVVQRAPKWIPGKQRGTPVRVYMTLPINFVLR